MGWLHIAVLLVAFQATSLLLPPRAAADDFLSPIFSPVIDRVCDVVQCGKGSCQVSLNHSFGFVCECNPGWSQLHVEDHLRFLPCVIPNCSLDYSCSNLSSPPAPPPVPAPSSNLSIFDPCLWSYCGRGSCSKTSTFEHQCECDEGSSNLLNFTSLPCYKACSIGADCSKLGISISNASTSSSPPGLSIDGSSSARDYSARRNLLWSFFLMISLAMAAWAT